jgi:AcrR family transcriptional regulator
MNPDSLLPDAGTTRARILLTALRVFATRGFEAASLRQITQLSKVNVAAIHYHFGSKEVLIREVLRSVSEPLNQLRLQGLERPLGAPALPLEQIIEALVGPPVMLSFQATGEWRLLIRLLVQARSLPREATNATIFEQYDAMAQRFVLELMAAEPGLEREEAFWRYSFAIGAMMYIVTDADESYQRLSRISDGLCDTNDPGTIVRQLVTFIAAGMRAGSPARVGARDTGVVKSPKAVRKAKRTAPTGRPP